ncbi:two-component system response regulator OmpR [Serratia marcescens]|uniref:osmolarity response regulator transcription factor OmpR n=1 Tax=Serratia marcescens TaxID=615 RepID=UPI000F7E1E4E|nr:two-component system response regulator OmpR [Serratia marcescens]RTF93337.1 two-component system response regulator OmpR [Serratia marcescens]RTG09706.1 two-component system response regulator OmpR [Serratia marcescens]
MQTPHILIVEDELVTRNTLKSIFEAEGYIVHEANDGAEMHNILSENDINLVIMDINLPGKNGLLLARELREQASVALMFLTGRDNEVDKILGLEIGADDYIPKPFNPRELLARIRAVLRRQANELPGAPSQEEAVIAFGKFKLNLGTREMFREDEPMPLTSGEFAVLKALVSHPREPLSRDKLMNLARGREYSAMERSIDVQISRLRRMVEEDPAHPRYIQTVWGLGYVFVPDGSKA